jgi:hypothetical protein
MTSMPPGDQLRALNAAQNFIKTQMRPADLMAILRYSGSSVDVLSDFIADRDRLLSILQTLLVGEDRALEETQAQLRAGVSFWPIDARGLVAEAPLGDATQGSQGNIGMYTGAAALALTSDFQQSQDTLYALANDTGGRPCSTTMTSARGWRRQSRRSPATTPWATTPPPRPRMANFAASRFR